MVLHALLFAFALATVPLVTAQTNGANCTDSTYNWVFNSKRQSPCYVAEVLAGPCDPAGFTIPSLPSGQVYFGPTSLQANSCQCSSVFYSLLSACAACQDRNWITWSSYTANCSQVWLTVYANPISADTSVPHWAYLDVSAGNKFDATSALSAVGPESTQGPSPTSTPSSTSKANSNHAGAIAGGVVGGIVFLSLVAGATFWFYTRNKAGSENVAWTSLQTRGNDVLSTSLPPTGTTAGQPMYQLQKLYDPQDPSTYPPAADQNTIPLMDQSLTGTTYASHPDSYKVQGNYTGVPEV